MRNDRLSARIRLAENGCWEWRGAKNGTRKGTGYGLIWNGNGHWKMAHRVIWEMTNGPVPDGLQVLHRCDNPGCVRRDHMFLGTQGDNVRDCRDKGRLRFKGGRRPMTRTSLKDAGVPAEATKTPARYPESNPDEIDPGRAAHGGLA